MKEMYVWPDGEWCWPEEYCEYHHVHKSDDFAVVSVSDRCDDEDADRIADLHAIEEERAFAQVFRALGEIG